MIRIIGTAALTDLRETAARHLRRAEDTEQAAADAGRDAGKAHRIAQDWREFAAKAEEDRAAAGAERDKAQAQLADMLRGQAAALTEGEQTAISWAREHPRWGDKGRLVAAALRQQFPRHDDAELARLALYFGTAIGHADRDWPGLDAAGWAHVLKAAAVELAEPGSGSPIKPSP